MISSLSECIVAGWFHINHLKMDSIEIEGEVPYGESNPVFWTYMLEITGVTLPTFDIQGVWNRQNSEHLLSIFQIRLSRQGAFVRSNMVLSFPNTAMGNNLNLHTLRDRIRVEILGCNERGTFGHLTDEMSGQIGECDVLFTFTGLNKFDKELLALRQIIEVHACTRLPTEPVRFQDFMKARVESLLGIAGKTVKIFVTQQYLQRYTTRSLRVDLAIC